MVHAAPPPPQPIVFVMKSELWSVHADGTHLRQLTRPPLYAEDPSVSPDRKRIVYVRFRGGGPYWVKEMNVDGSGDHAVTAALAGPETEPHDPVMEPHGTTIAFEQGKEIVATRGGPPWTLTMSPTVDVAPAWSPDGRMIAFIRLHPDLNSGDLEVVSSVAGTRIEIPQRIAASIPALTTRLRWAPSGRAVLVEFDEGGYESVSTGPGHAKSFHRGPPGIASPSPDGRWVAYVASVGGGVHVARPDGADARLVYDSLFVTSVTW